MQAAKRFYKTVRIVLGGDTRYEIHLDGHRLKTPGKVSIALPSKAHAEIIAREWDAQMDKIRPETMPCTRLVNVALERTPKARESLISEARGYAGTDLLCYRATDPAGLVVRQKAQWDPVLQWAAEQGMALQSTDSVLAIDQDAAALDAVADYVGGLDDLALTLCVHLIAVYGSAILGIAVMKHHLSAEGAFTLSRLDENWQTEQWGEDAEAAERAQALLDEVSALSGLLSA